MKKSDEKQLNSQQLKFCQYMVDGLSNTAAYLKAYPGCKSDSAASSCSTKLLGNVSVIKKLDELREASETKHTLSRIEKRKYMKRGAFTPFDKIKEGGENSDLIQEITKTIRHHKDGSKTETVKIKMVSRLECIKIDNAIAGHNSPEDLNLNLGFGKISIAPIEFVRQNTKPRPRKQSAD